MKIALVTEEHSQSRQVLTRLSCFMMPVSYRFWQTWLNTYGHVDDA